MTRPEPVVYAQCGLSMRSEIVLDLPTSVGDRWDVEIRFGDDTLQSGEAPAGKVIAQYGDGETTWYIAVETASGYLVRFSGCGDFVISGDLSEVVVRRNAAGRPELLPILLAGTVSAFLLTLRGVSVLHASAVAVDGAVLAFVGRSGQGKSTIAALMCLGGAQLVTDDILAVDPGPPITCVGGASELRLRDAAAHLADARPDSPSHMTVDDRRTFAPMPAPAGPLPLAAIVIPSPSRTVTEVELRQLSASDAMFAVMAFPRIYGWRRHDVLTRDFAMLGNIANHVPVYQATIPWGPPFRADVATGLMTLAQRIKRSH